MQCRFNSAGGAYQAFQVVNHPKDWYFGFYLYNQLSPSKVGDILSEIASAPEIRGKLDTVGGEAMPDLLRAVDSLEIYQIMSILPVIFGNPPTNHHH